MKTKSKIEKQLQRKTNSKLIETIIACKKNKAWLEIAGILSSSRKKRINLNLEEINKKAKESKVVIVPGKVLSQGELDKKIKIVALDFSEKAREKLSKAKIETLEILQEIKKNPEAKGIEVLKQ